MNATPSPIVCVGEILWDALPSGLFLGGAPLNVACQLQQLGRPVVMASRVGTDRLGATIRQVMGQRGLSTNLLQCDPRHETGFVNVTFKDAETPVYEIVAPAAWDELELTPELHAAAQAAPALVFGSLAQRSERTRATIQGLLDAPGLKVFDVNLRSPFVDRELIATTLRRSELLKLNEEELAMFAEWFGLRGDLPARMQGVCERFELRGVVVTRGGAGCVGLWEGTQAEAPGVPVTVADPVGAGDAFLAGLLAELLRGRPLADSLRAANAVGAFVASRSGATPALPDELLNQFFAD